MPTPVAAAVAQYYLVAPGMVVSLVGWGKAAGIAPAWQPRVVMSHSCDPVLPLRLRSLGEREETAWWVRLNRDPRSCSRTSVPCE
jgi:hypothetical protein